MSEASCVAVANARPAEYPPPPYGPSPENPVYEGVRSALRSLGLDRDNPFGAFIRPGDRVLIKPNLVRHYHPYGFDPRVLVTHASVLRPVCDFALRAAGPGGKITIADAPLQSCDFDAALRLSGIDRLVEYYRTQGIEIAVRDLRLVRAVIEENSLYGKVLVQAANAGDPRGYTHVDLGQASAHAGTGVDPARYRVTCYDPSRMARHHGGGKHEYVIANTMLEADAVINVAKLKTHQKAGLTAALKNFVGINGHKDCLPHHVKGTAAAGGDEYRSDSWAKRTDSWLLDAKEQTESGAARKAAAVAHRVLEAVHRREGYWAGSWYGNETIARTTIDLNRIVRYSSRTGRLEDLPQRKVFSIVDGVIAGDEDGPLAPTPRAAGVLLAGSDPVAVDMAAARVMGFRYRAIPTIRLALDGANGFRLAGFDEDALGILSDSPRWDGLDPRTPGDSLRFGPHQGWKGHLEL